MRKNLAKHTAKKLPLAKRVLALCFALIFVCSCLLPAFANGTGAELETPDTEVVEAADPGTEPEPMDLYDEPAAWRTTLPPVRLVLCGHVLKRYFSVPMRLDTVLIDGIEPRLTVVWRTSLRPLRKVEDVKALFLYAVRPRIAREVFEIA